MLRNDLAGAVCHSSQSSEVEVRELFVGLDKTVQRRLLQIATAFECSVDQVLTSLHDHLCALVMLHLHTAPQVEILEEWASCDDDFG